MDKSYRIHTNISKDTLLQVNMKQDFDFLEVLSLKLRQKDAYKLYSSNYGVIVGRVLANDAFGIPNAKISVFIARDGNDTSEVESIYPYSEVASKDKEGRRYNLLPDDSDDDCYRVVGTFPNKRLVLDNDIQLEIYDKYWKYTTVTNNAGDYMLFGVPTGSVTVHVDIDLSDIGVLSQKPRDFEYKGYSSSMFDSSVQFKESTNLDNLAQLFSQNKSVFVYPFWGDEDNGIAAITRSDIQIQYKFEPTCVFMGSIISDNDGHAIGHKCAPDVENGMNNQLIGGEGTIEMIRRTTDGLVEEFQIQGNQLIDENGVWCYQIPMNLDYIGTDEYGNIVATDNPNKGIPTRTQVRFRISKNETSDEGISRHTAKYLVPMNPIFSEESEIPRIHERGAEVEKMYNFGSTTPLSCFRDLYWNNVYSVKNYIPKVQVARRATSKNYGALKGANLAEDKNQIPFNKLNIDISFVYMIICIIYTIVVWVVWFINMVLCSVLIIFDAVNLILKAIKWFTGGLINISIDAPDCLALSPGIDEGNDVYFVGCWCGSHHYGDCPDYMEDNRCHKHGGAFDDDKQELIDRVQRRLAVEYKIVKLDFYQDWINGVLYMPLWFWRKRKKRSYLFGLFTRRAKNEYCSDSNTFSKLKTIVTCNLGYNSNDLGTNNATSPESEHNWHKNRPGEVRYRRGLIKQIENNDGLNIYYYSAIQPTSENDNEENEMGLMPSDFQAIRLYATDIILLGNLNVDNIYGIPQFYRCLPSTTANIPPIATIEDEDDENDNAEATESALVTGMDWNHDGDEETPIYKTGLFMDLACTYARTRVKSCVNVERMSELGVSLDMRYDKSYRNGGSIEYGVMDTDGFITKHELDDTENRSMFATMNHIGFIPQEYQNVHNLYETQVLDSNTNYFVPKFKYLYLVDFDGRMTSPIEYYAGNFNQDTVDVVDNSYLTFRLGSENGRRFTENTEGRIRHFYHVRGEYHDMPLYNNSFYFFFGIKKGSTAIDKFNKMFNSDCVNTDKKPFTLDVESRGASYCPIAYDGVNACRSGETYAADSNANNAFAYIAVNSDDIRMPYTYSLMDSLGHEIVSESNMNTSQFVIGGRYTENNEIVSNCSGEVYTQIADSQGNYEFVSSGLTNQNYTLVLTDSDGREMVEHIEMTRPKLSATYGKTDLGTKFFDENETPIGYICDTENAFYGEIRINGITVDGYNCRIVRINRIGYTNIHQANNDESNNDESINVLFAELELSSSTISNSLNVILYLYALDSVNGSTTRNCMCEVRDEANVGTYQFEDGVLTFFIYHPSKYVITLRQCCPPNDFNRVIYDNTSNQLVEIRNGKQFEAYLNKMPLRFMTGVLNDDVKASSASTNGNHFYNGKYVIEETNPSMVGWYGVHQEDTYMFTPLTNDTIRIWNNYISNGVSDIEDDYTRLQVITYKFKTMFSLSDGVYVSNDSSSTLKYTTTGGIKPILTRSFIPEYSSFKDGDDTTYYTLSDNNKAVVDSSYPNIVTSNYLYNNRSSHTNDGPHFNPTRHGEVLKGFGNYFAAFTKDGGYVTNSRYDDSIHFEKRPSFAYLDRRNRKGVATRYNFEDATYAYEPSSTDHSLPYFRAMTVDRRLDFDLIVFSPANERVMRLYGVENDIREQRWRGIRISGYTYNGIEMSYDRDYNVITNYNIEYDEEGVVSSRTPVVQLEYDYSIDSAITIYNQNREYDWEEYASGGTQIIKRLYEANINGVDVRNFFWSSFNKEPLNKHRDSVSATTYIYTYPYSGTNLYNGDFNMISVSGGENYPTKRYIDIAGLRNDSYFNFNATNCSYSMSPYINDSEDGVVCETNFGDEINVNISFVKNISIVPPNQESNEYYNVKYELSRVMSGTSATFSASSASFTFKYNTFNVSEYNSYTRAPRIIKVLPYINDVDGISYFKLCNNYGKELVGQNDLNTAINTVTLYDYNNNECKASIFDVLLGIKKYYMAYYPDGVDLDTNHLDGYYYKDYIKLQSNNEDFLNIMYTANIDLSSNSGVTAFAILSERDIYSENSEEEHLTRRIRLIETSEIFDCRKINLEINSGETYAVMRNLYSGETVEAVTSATGSISSSTVSSETNDGEESTTDTNDGESETVIIDTQTKTVQDTTKQFTQRVGFTMVIDKNDTNFNMAFYEIGMMSFTFKFEDSSGTVYDVRPQVSISSGTSDTYEVTFVNVWDSGMSILYDVEKWNMAAKVSFIAKTKSGFVYQTDFSIKDDSENPPSMKDMEADKNYYNKLNFV